MDKANAFLDLILNNPFLSLLISAGLVETLLRRKESQKALSIVLGFQALLRGGISLAQKLDQLISKIIPHKIAAPQLPENNSEMK